MRRPIGTSASWPVCIVMGCGGAVVDRARCIAHAPRASLPGLLAADRAFDARGVVVTADLFEALVASCRASTRPTFGACDFSGAEFVDDVDLAGAIFASRASFVGAIFHGRARFSGARFERDADFERATFAGELAFGGAQLLAKASFRDASCARDADFSGVRWGSTATLANARFAGKAWFSSSVFAAAARFDDARFGPVSFSETAFRQVASFRDAAFEHNARFVDATFGDVARFERARFAQQARFDGASFDGDARFIGARFGGVVSMRSLQCARSLSLHSATVEGKLTALATAVEGIDLGRVICKEPAALLVAAPRIDGRGAEFRAGVNLAARWAELLLDDAIFDGSSVVGGVSRLGGLNEEPVVDALRQKSGAIDRRSIPLLASALRADLGGVTFDQIDMARTRVSGAINLDRVRLNGSVVLDRAPRGLRRGRALPPLWWWTRRQVLGEEATWRAAGRKASGWATAREAGETRRGSRHARHEAERIAATYRDLRKGREELGNAPGAADLYYGEMEMRRHAAPRLGVERLVLDAYWLISGYALRGGRALACLLVTLCIAAVGFHQFGFADLDRPFESATAVAAPAAGRPPPRTLPQSLGALGEAASMPEAWIYAAAAAVPGAALPRARLTSAGQAMTVALRVLGPLFIGLALLSIRGRVKR